MRAPERRLDMLKPTQGKAPGEPPGPLELARKHLQGSGTGPVRSVGIMMVFLGAMFGGQAVQLGWHMLRAETRVEATVEQRWYDMRPNHKPEDAARVLASGPVLWGFNAWSTAVLRYEGPGGSVQRTRYENERSEAALTGDLDRRVPVPWIELRFPPGTIETLKALSRDPVVDLDRPCGWCRTRYDELMQQVDDPERVLIQAWTSAAGPGVKLRFDPARPALALLDDDKGPALLGALPALLFGGFFLGLGLFLSLRDPRVETPPGGGPPVPRRKTPWDRAWLVVVLTAPFWVQAFPSIVRLYSSEAAQVVVELSRRPVMALQFFGVVMPEPVEDVPYESVRALAPDSVYLPLWSEFRFERPENCCETAEAVRAAAIAQATAQLARLDVGRRAQVGALLEELERYDRRHLTPIVRPALERMAGTPSPSP